MLKGVAFSIDTSPFVDYAELSAGTSIAQTSSNFSNFQFSGAWGMEPVWASSAWIGLKKSYSLTSDLTVTNDIKLIHWSIKQNFTGLMTSDRNQLRINEIELRNEWKSKYSKISLNTLFAASQVSRPVDYTVSLPTLINEYGEISFTNAIISTKGIFNERRFLLDLKYQLRKNANLSFVYGFKSQHQFQQIIGLGLNLNF
jgi:hypothetical protein